MYIAGADNIYCYLKQRVFQSEKDLLLNYHGKHIDWKLFQSNINFYNLYQSLDANKHFNWV